MRIPCRSLRAICLPGLALFTLFACFADGPVQSTSELQELEYNRWLLSKLYLYPDELISADSLDRAILWLQQRNAPIPDNLKNLTDEDYLGVAWMYALLSDIHTRYVPPMYANAQQHQDTSTTVTGALGVELLLYPDSDSLSLQIRFVYPQSPAEQAGLKRGDWVYTLEDSLLSGPGAGEMFNRISQGKQTVSFRVIRQEDTLAYQVTKGFVWVPTVLVDTIQGVPVFELREFVRESVPGGGSSYEFRQALKQNAQAPAVVLDLRGNPGGEVRECLAMANEMVDQGTLIYLIYHSFDGRGMRTTDTLRQDAVSGGEGVHQSFVLLADQYTASCAEIFIAAVQENRSDIPVVGTRTYGKAVGQSRWSTPAGGLAVITNLEIRTPKGNDYQGIGLIPSVLVDSAMILHRGIEIAAQKGVSLPKRILSDKMQKPFSIIFESAIKKRKSSSGAWWLMGDNNE